MLQKKDYPKDSKYYYELEELLDNLCPGGSSIIDPFENYLVEPVRNEETIIYQELDMNQVSLSRLYFDPTGHYSHPDIFHLENKDI